MSRQIQKFRGAATVVSAALVALTLVTAPVKAEDPIKIGFGMALTGALAGAGKAALIAMEIWAEDVNAAGGLLGRPVELILTYSYPSNMIQDATASCLAAGARLLVSGQGPEPGNLAPERLDPAPFLNDMRSGGVVFTLDEKYDVGRR